uniref:RING-type domain-containing protein n=1 Tax=Leersia perrieri TaxID=77586 RepID=A0A0D9XL57_9ORYZ
MRKAYKDSLKVLEADIQHANTLASEFPREYDGACLQMRLSYSPAAHIFLFLVQWTDCSLAGALGLLRILVYKVYVDGTTTMSTHERKASLKEFYAVIFPSLLQLQRGITDTEDKKQKAVCMERYRRRDEDERNSLSEIDAEREEECGICMEMNSKVVLPNCTHAMCLRCYQDWNSRSQSCPFCRDNLKKTDPGDLWIYVEDQDVVDMETVSRENLRRLFMYINKLPLIVPDSSTAADLAGSTWRITRCTRLLRQLSTAAISSASPPVLRRLSSSWKVRERDSCFGKIRFSRRTMSSMTRPARACVGSSSRILVAAAAAAMAEVMPRWRTDE